MLLLIDVSAGHSIADALRTLGNDVAEVHDRDPHLPDNEILAWAVAEQRLVVTMDKDFGELVFRSGQSHSGVLLLRLDAARRDEKIRIVTDIFNQYANQLPNRFAVFQDGRLRIR